MQKQLFTKSRWLVTIILFFKTPYLYSLFQYVKDHLPILWAQRHSANPMALQQKR